jgi:hypothetical protein
MPGRTTSIRGRSTFRRIRRAACTRRPTSTSGQHSTDGPTTQDESITQQLDQGVRYLDLQVAYNGNGSPTLGWRVTQNVFSDFPLYDYLDQVAQWAHQHPTEVVIIGIRRICYDGNPTTAIDDGLWSNFSTPSTIGGGGTTIADVAFDAASLGKNSFATATIDDIVQQQGGGHTVVVLAPSTAVARGVLARKYDVHAAFTTLAGGPRRPLEPNSASKPSACTRLL